MGPMNAVTLKISLLLMAFGLFATSASATPYCDGTFDDHLNQQCIRSRLISIRKNTAINAALSERVIVLSKHLFHGIRSQNDSNYFAFIHAAKACYDVNEAGEFTADLAGVKFCASIRNSNMSRSLAIYAQMTKTNLKVLAKAVETDPESFNDLVIFLRSQTQENLDRTDYIWKTIYKRTFTP